MREYQDHADEEILAIGTIEHVDAIGAIGEIVATPGLDLVFIGPGDLATSMGHRGRVGHPDVQAAMKTLEEAIRPSPVILGGVATTATGGRLLIPVGDAFIQDLFRVTKTEAGVKKEDLGGCRFVKLIGKYGWKTE